MEYLALLLASTSVSTLFFAWKYLSARKVIARRDAEMLESHTQLRYKLDSTVQSLESKEIEVIVATKKLAECSALIGTLEAGKGSVEATLREVAEREKGIVREAGNREKLWDTEKAALQRTVRNYEALLDRSQKLSRKNEDEKLEGLRKIQEMQVELTEKLKSKDEEVVALKGQLTAHCHKADKASQELADRESAIASLRQSVADLRSNACKKEKLQSQYNLLQTQYEQLKAKAEKERSALQQELARIKRQIGEANQDIDQWKKRYEEAGRQCVELQSTVEARDRQVQSLEEQRKAALSAVQRSTDSDVRVDCVVCLDRPKCILLEPCRHICVCQQCSQLLHACPLCTRTIKKRKFGYLSL